MIIEIYVWHITYISKKGLKDIVLYIHIMYLQLRITPQFTTDPCVCRTNLITSALVEYLDRDNIETFAVCSETLNKFGEKTHPHWHFNIVGDFPDLRKDSFQAWFRRRPFGPKGNKSYSFKMVGDPEDENRWHRYLLKETNTLQGCKGIPLFPEGFDRTLNEALAQDERKIQIKRNLDARERMLQTSSFKTVMFADILKELQKENNGSKFKFYDIWFLIQGYFRHKGKVVPYSTLPDYTYDFMITYGIITPAEYFMQRHGSAPIPHRDVCGILRSEEEE